MRKLSLLFCIFLLKSFSIMIPLLVSVAYFTIAERKIMGIIQRRKGPNVVGFVGLLQPLADGLKLFTKETVLPSDSNVILFLLAPLMTFLISLMGWCVLPYNNNVMLADLNIGVLYLLSVSSLGVYGVLIAGWSSNSKYAFLGALRSASQMISYEISIGFVILTVCACAGSFNITEIVLAQEKGWYVLPLFPMFILFNVSMLAETNRHPFDLPEAEAELVSGYNVEYSAMTFALFFLGEYASMLLMSTFSSIMFLGGWLCPFYTFSLFGSVFFSIKILLGVLFFIISRAALPRYRYDQLMSLGWKSFLPFSLGYFLFTVSVLICTNSLPN